MKELRALIVDDEYPAREEIRYHLSEYDDIIVVGEAASTDEALALLKSLEYDLVFLDINFPVKNGIELGLDIASIPNAPKIIYITAYDEYAVKAFDVNASDYILKPIDPEKFKRAITRVRENFNWNQKSKISPESPALNKDAARIKISAEKNGNIVLINPAEIQFAYSEDSYVFIKTFEDVMITRYTMVTLEEKLKRSNFFRAHRCYLINLDNVKEISPMFKGSCILIMSDKKNSRIQVSRRKAGELKEIFDI